MNSPNVSTRQLHVRQCVRSIRRVLHAPIRAAKSSLTDVQARKNRTLHCHATNPPTTGSLQTVSGHLWGSHERGGHALDHTICSVPLSKDGAVCWNDGNSISTGHNVLLGMTGRVIGGMVGNLVDIVTIRMQVDSQLPAAKRRHYKHVVDGLIRVEKEEGPAALVRGIRPDVVRAMMLTRGQIAVFDLVRSTIFTKHTVLKHADFMTYVMAGMVAGLVATTACAPAGVGKTRLMNMHMNEYKSATDCLVQVVKLEGLRRLHKGCLPAYVRLGAQTLLTFVFLEQIANRLL
uniref:Uncharacterized protein n=1 Tax=Peronospora matthiolae TaxID=2874970 RepID=A0AAV1TGZ2_9STRA